MRLREGLHWCDCDGRAVFLDVHADRYFCLPNKANEAFLALAETTARRANPEALRPLVERGLLVAMTANSHIEAPPTLARPIRDASAAPLGASGLLLVVETLAAEARIAWRLRMQSFADVLARARGARLKGSRDRQGEPLERIAAALNIAALLTRAHDRCLVRALAAHAICAAHGIRPKLVLGVTAQPFAAHSWVQLDDAVIVGGFEQARLYTPILVIE